MDEALSGRRRADALAELGEIVLDLVRRGEIDVAELPEAREVIGVLDELDAGEAEAAPPVARGALRKRFDDRPSPAPRRKSEEDGTVSSTTWAPPTRAKPGAAKVWRPPVVDDVTEPGRPPVRPRPAKPGARRGGISFESDDDSDLEEYMHPDDVPGKPKDEP